MVGGIEKADKLWTFPSKIDFLHALDVQPIKITIAYNQIADFNWTLPIKSLIFMLATLSQKVVDRLSS